MDFELSSPAFVAGKSIPQVYTCEGKNISPPLVWEGEPKGTQSFVLICDDPDAPRLWTHWVVYNIPPISKNLKENIPPKKTLPDGTLQGLSDFKSVGYGGPCPPSGTHRYFFKLYALDTLLEVPPSASRQEVEKAMKGHILAEASYMGTYKLSQKK